MKKNSRRWSRGVMMLELELSTLSPNNGFKVGDKPFVFQEVIDLGNEAVRRQVFIPMGKVIEFTGSNQIGMIFRGIDRDLSALEKWASAETGFLIFTI